jgi:hypothetical protein
MAMVVASIAALSALWALVSTQEASVLSEMLGQALTWVGIEHNIGTDQGGPNFWMWLSIAAIASIGAVGLVVISVGLVWIGIIFFKEPKVQDVAHHSADRGRKLSNQSLAQTRAISKRGKAAGAAGVKRSKESYNAWRQKKNNSG